MKYYLFILLLLPGTVMGRTAEPDSADVNNLDEITIVAKYQSTDAVKTVYLPEARQKSSASDGISLLAQMNIPQINVIQTSGKVSTVDGQPIAMFINSREATDEDIAGLNPTDVKRVEYLDYPTDACYMRAPHVVNFVIHRYYFGGYTKMAIKERFLVNSGTASAYSKFALRKLEFDATINGDYDINSHSGDNTVEVYRFLDNTMERQSITTKSKQSRRDLSAAMRTAWNKSENLSIRNTVSVFYSNTPTLTQEGRISFSDRFPSDVFSHHTPQKDLSVGWQCNLLARMSHGWTLNSDISAHYTTSTSAEFYSTSTMAIDNLAKEKGLATRINTQVNKLFTEQVTLFSSLIASGSNSDIAYRGTNFADNSFNQWFGGLTMGISFSKAKVAGSIDGGFALEINSTNRKRTNDGYPFTHINLQFSPDTRNRLGLWAQYATLTPSAAMKSPNILRLTELMSVSGNPNLKSSRFVTANINYTYLPNNRWQLTTYATLFRIANRQAPVYLPTGPDDTMLKFYMNDGNYNHGQIGARVSARFLGGALVLAASPRILLYSTSSMNKTTLSSVGGNLNIDYYAGAFCISAFGETSSSYVDGETCYRRKLPGEYSLSIGWHHRGWNIRLSAANFFNSAWITSRDTLSSTYYENTLTKFGTDRHRRISVFIQYTLNYGKKIAAGAEITTGSGIKSSILH